MIGYIKTVGKGKELIKVWLTDFWPMKTLARKHQKTKGFLVFVEAMKWELWPEMG